MLKGKTRGDANAKGHFSDTGVTPSLGAPSLPLPGAVLCRPLCAGHRLPWEPRKDRGGKPADRGHREACAFVGTADTGFG